MSGGLDMVNAVKGIEWKEIQYMDREAFINYGSNRDGIAMFGFTSLFLWKDYYNTRFAIINNNVVARGLSDDGENVIYFPRGIVYSVKETVEEILSDVGNKVSLCL